MKLLSDKNTSLQILAIHEVLATRLAERESPCQRLKVGSVLINDNLEDYVSFGVNAPPSYEEQVCEIDNVTKPSVIHAERKMIFMAAKYGISLDGKDIYVTHSPCVGCATDLIEVGVKRVFFGKQYRDLSGADKLLSRGVAVYQYMFGRVFEYRGKNGLVLLPADEKLF